ncbi:MAG: hypothetical protein PVG92_07800 [Holophagae bacterium]
MVLTGYNTDIEYSGTTYHVQTEDKGSSNPLVESLVYTSGEILYTRRTPYHDMVEQQVDKEAVASLMERQHRAIVEAVQRGGLGRLTGSLGEVEDDDTTVSGGREAVEDQVEEEAPENQTLDQVILQYLESQRGKAHLMLRAAIEHEFVYGASAQVSVVAVASHGRSPQAGVRIEVLFKSTTEPRRMLLAEGETDQDGAFAADTQMPAYSGGTSAVVITAESELGRSEMKHLVRK